MYLKNVKQHIFSTLMVTNVSWSKSTY